jgi:DNA-binding IclR family transcriptional regulator
LVGIELLKTIGQLAEPATLSEISRAARLTPSRAHRLLTALVQTELLTHDANSGRYHLGPGTISLGLAAIARVDAVQIASSIMRELTNSVGLVSNLCTWGSHGPTLVYWEVGNLEFGTRLQLGFTYNLVSTATGRVFLAYLDLERINEPLKRDMAAWNAIAKPTSRRVTRRDLPAMRSEVLAAGMSCVIAMGNPRIAAIAAPIFNHDGFVMSLSTGSLDGTFDTTPDGKPARELKAAAARISYYLGGHEPAR